MAQSATLAQLSTTLNIFNDALNEPNKLNVKALQTIQQYLNNPKVTTLDQADGEIMQHTLEYVEKKLRESIVIERVSSVTIKKINRQLENLAELILENRKEIVGDAYFIIVKLEVSFLDILSDEQDTYDNDWQKMFEKNKMMSEIFESSPKAPQPCAFYLDRQQRLISELMNAAIFNVIEYFQEKEESFSEYFTKKFLDSLSEKAKNLNHVFKDNISNDVFTILSTTAGKCKIPMTDLIHHLRYAITGFEERVNEFADSLQDYIEKTESPTLAGFNKTLPPSWALTQTEVDLFSGLFDLYCEILLCPSDEIPQILVAENISDPALVTARTTPSIMIDTADTIEIPKTLSSVTESTTPASIFTVSATCSSPSTETSMRPLLYETDLKFIWIEDGLESYHELYRKTIEPAYSTYCAATEVLSNIPNDWINSRIFLFLNARNALSLLPSIHRKMELYRIYVLCNDQSEENQFSSYNILFGKKLLVTSDEKIFIQQLALDILPSLVEIGDLYLNTNEYDNASRWFESAREKINEYDKSKNKLLLPLVEKRLMKCSR
ncbi:unnamed protein product [Rotaria magnacalcarata]|uniref:Uncharacterized protein n=5 Tax=Rotaria magnacalcarata TaxID=392030 RepID=A0A815DB82_9BILA|nr:unnamed protein product [Rotaria magnacalcarata]CAF1295476.1 unnamed protein product [Rotaria magnacalcarata]CAF1940078.1 unnamed protein product [Rotaria magnacalcarata]CAF3845706.1 unnamed protein product [Rotaria magnacalcarata]